jgi:hypothetical protein
MSDQKLLFKGHVLKPGDYVKAVTKSGAETFYRVVRVWGSHGVFRVVTEQEAGQDAISITVQPEVERRRGDL